MQRSAVPVEGVEFVDKFGDTRLIHHNNSANGPLRVLPSIDEASSVAAPKARVRTAVELVKSA